MKTIFSADNGFEAQNILNLINQAGIVGRIEGEFLQGAFGELPPAMGMVRVLVDSADVEAATRIVEDWASGKGNSADFDESTR